MPILLFYQILLLIFAFSKLQAEDRIPFYEDFIDSGNLSEYLELAHKFLDNKPNAIESPRMALDLIMMGKAAEDLDSVVRGTDLLLFSYLGSLPSLHFISSFDKGSPRLTQLLKIKLNEADFNDQNFSNSFADAVILLARIHGPELMKDPSLLIYTYLVVQGTDKKELIESLSKALDVLEEKDQQYRPLISLCRSNESPLVKISELHKFSAVEIDFFIKFFTALLTEEEKNSPEFLKSMIHSTLFGVPPRPDLALGYLSSLPDELSTRPRFQLFTAFAHLLDGNSESTTTILKSVSESSSDNSDPWVEVAQSLLEGTEFGASRKALLLEQLSKLYNRWQRSSEAFLVEGTWNEDNPSRSFSFQIGVDNKRKSFEIHFLQNERSFFSYKVDSNQSFILSTSGKNIKFDKGGAYPLPQTEIKRDTEGGAFNYSFNLNFGKNFEDFAGQITKNLSISYLSTEKGREVLLNHLFERKGMWLAPPASSDRGTVFTINQIDPDKISQNYKIEISASGELISLLLGNLHITNFSQGNSEILSTLPQFPTDPEPKHEADFQLSVLIESIGELIKKASN